MAIDRWHMTENNYSIHSKINSHQRKLQHLYSERKLYSSGNYFNAGKVDNLNLDIDIETQSIEYYENVLETRYQEEKSLNEKDTMKDLEYKAYGGDQEAIEKLIKISKGGFGSKAKGILISLAEKGDQATAKILLDAFGKDGAVLAALIKGNSNYAQDATEHLADLPLNGTSNSKDTGFVMTTELEIALLENLSKDPERNIHRIAKFAHTERGATTLADIAVNKPTTYAGQMATRALGKAFINGNNKVANIALKGLITAGTAGNGEAVNVLTNIAKSPAVSNNKAALAIDGLAEIASSAAQSGSDNTNTAMGALTGIAQDKDVSPKLRAHAIKHLGKLITNGADPQMNATSALIDLAKNADSPLVAETAREEVFKAAENNPAVLDKGVELFHEVAKGSKPATNKVKKQAVDLLGKAAENGGPNAEKATDSLLSLTKNHNQIVARRSKETLEHLGLAINKDQELIKTPTPEEENKNTEKKLENQQELNLFS